MNPLVSQDIECIFSLKLNLNTFFAIFDINNDDIVRGGEIMEFGKRRNMRGMANLAGILLGDEGIQSQGFEIRQKSVFVF